MRRSYAQWRERLVHHKTALLAILRPPRSFVTLKMGPTLPVEAIELALSFEERGIPLDTDNDQLVLDEGDEHLTDADCEGISRWRRHLAVIVEYGAPAID